MLRRFQIPLHTFMVPKRANRMKKSAINNLGVPLNRSQRYLMTGCKMNATATEAYPNIWTREQHSLVQKMIKRLLSLQIIASMRMVQRCTSGITSLTALLNDYRKTFLMSYNKLYRIKKKLTKRKCILHFCFIVWIFFLFSNSSITSV